MNNSILGFGALTYKTGTFRNADDYKDDNDGSEEGSDDIDNDGQRNGTKYSAIFTFKNKNTFAEKPDYGEGDEDEEGSNNENEKKNRESAIFNGIE